MVPAVYGGKDLWNRWGTSLEWKSKEVMDWTLKVMMIKTYTMTNKDVTVRKRLLGNNHVTINMTMAYMIKKTFWSAKKQYSRSTTDFPLKCRQLVWLNLTWEFLHCHHLLQKYYKTINSQKGFISCGIKRTVSYLLLRKRWQQYDHSQKITKKIWFALNEAITAKWAFTIFSTYSGGWIWLSVNWYFEIQEFWSNSDMTSLRIYRFQR